MPTTRAATAASLQRLDASEVRPKVSQSEPLAQWAHRAAQPLVRWISCTLLRALSLPVFFSLARLELTMFGLEPYP